MPAATDLQLDDFLVFDVPLAPQSDDSPAAVAGLKLIDTGAAARPAPSAAVAGAAGVSGQDASPPASDRQIANQPSTPFKRTLLGQEKGNGAVSGAVSEEDPNLDPAEAKRMKRMRRNRESAAMSRERKKAYIEELETKLAALSQLAAQLRSENEALRAGRDPLEGTTPAPVAPAPEAAPAPAPAPVPAPAAAIVAKAPAVAKKADKAEPAPLMPCLQSSDNDSEPDSASSFDAPVSLDAAASLDLSLDAAVSSLDVFTQEPPSGLSLPAEPAALFRDASFLA